MRDYLIIALVCLVLMILVYAVTESFWATALIYVVVVGIGIGMVAYLNKDY
jgi:hypothetical protein